MGSTHNVTEGKERDSLSHTHTHTREGGKKIRENKETHLLITTYILCIEEHWDVSGR
jgi:hypothetical protein